MNTNSINDGGPAFSSETMFLDQKTGVMQRFTGITLRDYFAAKAMHALIVEPPCTQGEPTAAVNIWGQDYTGAPNCEKYAFVAYRVADAMLKARES